MDLDLRSACLNPATVVMSGLGAPARASAPIPLCMRSMRLSASSFPLLISPSMMGGPAIRMSKLSPLSMRSTNLGPKPVMTLSGAFEFRTDLFQDRCARPCRKDFDFSSICPRSDHGEQHERDCSQLSHDPPSVLHKIEQSYVL